MCAKHHVTHSSSWFYRICNNTYQHSQRQDQALKILYCDSCSKICFSLDAMTHILHSPQCFIPSFPVTQANFLLKYLGCRLAFFKLSIYGLHPTTSTHRLESQMAWMELLHKDWETSLSGNVYCRKKRGLFLLLGWSVFLLMTDCRDLPNTGLTRKPFPTLFGPYTAFQASHLSPHGTAGQCWAISMCCIRSFKRYLC